MTKLVRFLVFLLFVTALALPIWTSRTVEGQAATEAPAGFDTLTNGIVVGGVANKVVMVNVSSINNSNTGLVVTASANVQIRDSVLSNNAGAGLLVDNSAVDVQSTGLSNNGIGIVSENAATVRISNATISGNGTGLSISGGAVVDSFGNNQIAGNLSGNSGVTVIPRQ